MPIDPNSMDQYLKEEQQRYQKKDAVPEPAVNIRYDEGYDEEDDWNIPQGTPPLQPHPQDEPAQAPQDFRHYNNPQHMQEEEILPGVFQSDIDSWKKQFNNQVYLVEIKGDPYVIRSMDRFEYKQIVSAPNTDPLMREEMMCELCVLYPKSFDFSVIANSKAGLPAVLSQTIMEYSSFTQDVKVTKL